MARGFIDRVVGLEEKRVWHELERRAKQLPDNYYQDYKVMQKYLFVTGPADWNSQEFIFTNLLDLLEELASEGRKVTDMTGSDVATFLDELVTDLGSKSWQGQYRDKLNRKIK